MIFWQLDNKSVIYKLSIGVLSLNCYEKFVSDYMQIVIKFCLCNEY